MLIIIPDRSEYSVSDSKDSVDFRIDHSFPKEVDANTNDHILRKMKIH